MTFDVIKEFNQVTTLEQIFSPDSKIYIGYIVKGDGKRAAVPLSGGKWTIIPAPTIGTYDGGGVYESREKIINLLKTSLEHGEIEIKKAFSTWIDVYVWFLEDIDYEEMIFLIDVLYK